jgi:tripartite-type tricarboxylate transporter receptor subunit TctC
MVRFLSVVAVLLAMVPSAFAQGYPTKPVRFIVPFAPGGPADIAARLVAQKLPESLGQQVLVDNRAGAGGNIGATAVAKSAPDGYTALVTTSAIAVNATLFANPGYDTERDFIPVVQIATQPNMIFVNAGAPAKSLDELIRSAQGTKLAYGSPGTGTTRTSPRRCSSRCWPGSTPRRPTSRAPVRWSRPSSAASRRSGAARSRVRSRR